MRVLVTGHKGYIGSIMTPMLLKEGYDVIGLDSDLFADCTFGPQQEARVPNIWKDVRDVEAADLDGVDAVVHLAGLSNDPLGYFDPDITDDINREASVQLAILCKEVGVQRFLFSSSCSVYGASNGEMLREESEPNPVTPYGLSKLLAEEIISKLADSSFSPTFLRSATAYGVSPKLRFDLVINNLVAWAYTTGRILLKSDGQSWRPLVHIEDISRAFIAVLRAPRSLIHNQTFNVGITAENYKIQEVADIVQGVVPNSRVDYSDDASPDKRSYRVDCSKIAQALPEFNPQWNVREGAIQLYHAYQKIGLKSIEEFEGPRYRRLKHLLQLLDNGQIDKSLRWEAIAR